MCFNITYLFQLFNKKRNKYIINNMFIINKTHFDEYVIVLNVLILIIVV